MGKKMQEVRLARFQIFLAALLIVVALFVGIPSIVYEGNLSDFDWPLVNIVFLYWPLFIGVYVFFAFPGFFLWNRAVQFWAAFVVCVSVFVWSRGVFQSHSFGIVDGKAWSATVPIWQGLLDIVVIVVGIVVVCVLSLYSGRAIIWLLVLLLLGMFIQAGPILFKRNWRFVSSESQMGKLSSFHQEKNVLVVLMDTMTSDVFEEVVAKSPRLQEALDGFLFYPDTVGVSPTTYLAMPTIHSGKIYDQHANVTLSDFYIETVRDNSVLTKVANAGFDSILVNPIKVCPEKLNCFDMRSALSSNLDSARAEGLKIFDIVLFRIAPLFLKDQIYNDGKWIVQSFLSRKEFLFLSVESNYLLSELSEVLLPNSSKPTLKFLHLMSTHPHYVYNEDCSVSDIPLPSNRNNVRQQVICSLDNFVKLLDSLKFNGVYNNTVIVLLSDHGFSGIKSNRTSLDGFGKLISAANPTFAIKPFHSIGRMQVIQSEIHISDFGPTLCKLIDACSINGGVSVFEAQSGRSRKFNHYVWKHEYWDRETIPDILSYDVNGPIADISSWVRNSEFVVELGKPVDFTKSGRMPYLQLAGWFDPEPWGTWSDGSSASLPIRLPRDLKKARLTLNANGYVGGGAIQVSVLAGDSLLGVLKFEKPNLAGYNVVEIQDTFEFSGENLDDQVVKFRFAIDKPSSPKENGLSPDDRQLGIGLKWFMIEELNDE